MLRYTAIALNLIVVLIALIALASSSWSLDDGLMGLLFGLSTAALNVVVLYRHAENAELTFVGLLFKRRRLELLREIARLEEQ